MSFIETEASYRIEIINGKPVKIITPQTEVTLTNMKTGQEYNSDAEAMQDVQNPETETVADDIKRDVKVTVEALPLGGDTKLQYNRTMAITNAQQYQQLVNKPADGKRPGYRGDAAYRSASEQSKSIGQGNVGSKESFGGGKGTDSSGRDEGAAGADRSYITAEQTRNQQKAKEKVERERKEKEAKEKAKKEKKEAKEKAKKEKKTKRMQKAAFDRFQKLEDYVDIMDDYGASGEDLARATGFKGDIESGFEYDKDFFRDSKTGKIKDQFTEMVDINKGKKDIFGNPLEPKFVEQIRSDAIPGYDFSINPVKSNFESGLGTLTSYPGGVRPNDYGLGTDAPGFLGVAQKMIRPETGLQAFNTLEEARNIQDFTTRFAEGDDSAYEEFEDYVNRNKPPVTEGGGGDPTRPDPCKGPNPPAYCNLPKDPTTPPPSTGVFAGIAPRFAGSIFDFDALRANAMDGGMIEDTPVGGIMDLESGRQMYFLGKLVKKATRAVKKIAKSPFGKAALIGLGAGMAGFGPASGLFGSGKGLAFKQFLMGGKTLPPSMGFKSKGLLGGILDYAKANPYKSIFAGSTLLGLMGDKEDKGFDLDEYYKTQGIDIDAIRNNPYRILGRRFVGMADGGRINYQEGGDAEPVAKKTMPLIDMDGKEKDYRETGGFVDMGRMERADDVPARLSKNEFVFTADAVRNAGDGDIDKGAEVMYNMMKNLEGGGDVSEESQGLEGARKMFQTSQRLGEVL